MPSIDPEGFISVVVGIMRDHSGRLLVGRRPLNKAHGGK